MAASDKPPVDAEENANAEADRRDERKASLRCWRCSFDLRAFRAAANCPACGSPVEISLTRQGGGPDGPWLIEDGLPCSRCGANLGGLDEDAACTACGLQTEVTLLAVDHTLPIDDAGILVGNVACRSCGYNLRSQHRSGRCPECGVDVESSLRQELLAFANPNWLRRVALGCKLVAIGLVILLAGLGAAFAYMQSVTLATIGGVAWCAGCLTAYVGLWLVAAVEPGAFGQYCVSSRRSIARAALLLVPVCWILLFALAVNPTGSLDRYFSVALGFLAGAGVVFGVVCYFSHLADVASRVPNKMLSKTCKNLGIALGWLIGVPIGSFLILLVLELAGVPTDFISRAVSGWFMAGVGVGLLLSTVIGTFIHWRIAGSLRKLARSSETRWS